MSSRGSWKRCGLCLLLAASSACARAELRTPPAASVAAPSRVPVPSAEPAPVPTGTEPPSPAVAPSPETRLLTRYDGTELVARYDSAACRASGRATLQVDVVTVGQPKRTFELAAQARAAAEEAATKVTCDGYLQSVETADFDFDGYADVALPVDAAGPYGSLSYDIMLFRPETNSYLHSAVLSELTENFIGLPQVDAERRRLISFSKSGCCVHWRSEASFVNGRLIEERSETETVELSGDACRVITETTRRGQKSLKKTRACTAAER